MNDGQEMADNPVEVFIENARCTVTMETATLSADIKVVRTPDERVTRVHMTVDGEECGTTELVSSTSSGGNVVEIHAWQCESTTGTHQLKAHITIEFEASSESVPCTC